ncbi:MAG: hypothetical protein JEZ10_06895 [Verrucomicrobia bacterium]|nr:hypothetical protein [Verrucomicrobiota bacterium]
MLTTDAVISTSVHSFSDVARAWPPHWQAVPLLGEANGGTTGVKALLKALMHPVLYNNLHHGIGMLLSSFALIAFLARKKINAVGICMALLTACWLGSNYTLIYAGHPNKPFVILFFILSLTVAGALSWRNILLWGAFCGLMFVQQPDVALFFAIFAGIYLLFCLGLAKVSSPWSWAKILIPAAVMALLFAAGPLLSGYKHQVKDAAQVQTQSPQEKWEYMTQWSFPPEEMIAFIAPGYTGWRSGEPEGPYWGRMGRSAGWEHTRQGFQNFKLENTYLGFIPVAFALFALFSCRRSKHRAEILFWGGATLVALLLAFGKFFPLYSLFYKLPVVNNIRNPNKFLQVFQVCLAILTAYGFDALFSQKSKVEGEKPETGGRRSEVRNFLWVTVGALGILVLYALSVSINRAGGVADFTAHGWPKDAAQIIVQNKITALWHASFMAAVVAAVFAIFSFPNLGSRLSLHPSDFSRHWKTVIGAGLVLIVAADAIKLSKHYVKEMPRSYIEANVLTDFLKKDLGSQRVALLSQQGIYGIWTTYLLPYNKIPTFNFSDMPRMASDYKVFLEAGQRDPLNMWRFSAVKYLLGPTAVEKQLVGQARKVLVYDFAPAGDNEFQVVSTPIGAHAVFELLNTAPRYAVTTPIEPMPDEKALGLVTRLPRPQAGSAEVLAYRPGKVKLRVSSDAPATLRIAEKWDADWKAEVDGAPAEVQRVDYLCQGVAIPAGAHDVELRYAPSKLFFYMQCAGYLILFGALVVVLLRRKARHAED